MKGVPEATIPWTECLTDIIFSWDDPDDESHVHFNITRLEQWLERNPHEIVRIPVDKEFAKVLPEMRGLEQHRLKRLLDNPKWAPPIILAMMPDGTGLIVDGNHRYYVAYALGWEHLKAYAVDVSIWGKFLVKMPEELEIPDATSIGWSGLL